MRHEVDVWNRALSTIGEPRIEPEPPKSITGIAFPVSAIQTTVAGSNPVQVNSTAHPFETGDEVTIEGVAGMTQINNRTFNVTKTGANSFTLNGEDGTLYPPGTGGTSYIRNGPPRLTVAGHGYATGDLVLVRGLDMTVDRGAFELLDNRVFQITVASSSVITLDDQGGTLGGTIRAGATPTVRRLPDLKKTRACFAAWPVVRDEVLRACPWNCAVKSTQIARLDTAYRLDSINLLNPAVILINATNPSWPDGAMIRIWNVPALFATEPEVLQLNDRFWEILEYRGSVHGPKYTYAINLDASSWVAGMIGGYGQAAMALPPLTPDSGYASSYPLPTDTIRLLEIVGSVLPWSVDGSTLYSDETGDIIDIRYIFRELNVANYTPMLAMVMALRLASDICEEITQSTRRVRSTANEFLQHMRRAMRVEGMEGGPSRYEYDPWLLRRL